MRDKCSDIKSDEERIQSLTQYIDGLLLRRNKNFREIDRLGECACLYLELCGREDAGEVDTKELESNIRVFKRRYEALMQLTNKHHVFTLGGNTDEG